MIAAINVSCVLALSFLAVCALAAVYYAARGIRWLIRRAAP